LNKFGIFRMVCRVINSLMFFLFNNFAFSVHLIVRSNSLQSSITYLLDIAKPPLFLNLINFELQSILCNCELQIWHNILDFAFLVTNSAIYR
jgi:hypothetical protein